MGESAEMVLDGTLCQQCGEAFEDMDPPGHPRTCAGCAGESQPRRKRQRDKKKGRGDALGI